MDIGSWLSVPETASSARLQALPRPLKEIPYFGENAAIFILAAVGRFVRSVKIFQTADQLNVIVVGVDQLWSNQIAGSIQQQSTGQFAFQRFVEPFFGDTRR